MPYCFGMPYTAVCNPTHITNSYIQSAEFSDPLPLQRQCSHRHIILYIYIYILLEVGSINGVWHIYPPSVGITL